MTDHPTAHFLLTLGSLVALGAMMVLVRNPAIRRRLAAAALMLLAAAGLHVGIVLRPQSAFLAAQGWNIERLLLSLAAIHAIVALLFNAWFKRVDAERAPAIVQDTLTAVVGVVAAMLIFQSTEFLTGSAIAAAVVGFAMQDTLGNAVSGIAIQIEKPFRVGHWITVGDFVGMVTEVTWRATKIQTKEGNLVVVPNSTIAKEAINNYSEPSAPSRLQVDVGAGYEQPPNLVREALLAAVAQSKYALKTPAPDVLLLDFGASAIVYRTRFWIDDYSQDDLAMDAVRTAIYYELRRRNIEIPWPIQIEYSREEAPTDTPERRASFAQEIAAVPVLASLPEEAHRALAAAATEQLFADGERIVGEGDPGCSMFVVRKGTVSITVGEERREVAVTKAGGYFGEMSLLTGDPRTATVSARGDATVLEINANAFRAYVQAHPEVIDQLAAAATARRRELDQTRAASGGARAVTVVSLRDRMREFFGLD